MGESVHGGDVALNFLLDGQLEMNQPVAVCCSVLQCAVTHAFQQVEGRYRVAKTCRIP